MRFIILTLLLLTALNAKIFAVVVVDNNTLEYTDSLKSEVEELFKAQDENFIGTNSLELTIDRDKRLKKIYTQEGTSKIIEYAKSKNYASIAFVEYKKGSKYLSMFVIVVNEKVQDKKSKSIAFSPSLSRELPATIVSNILSLNYELGVLNVKVLY